jgi:hypothetical protein
MERYDVTNLYAIVKLFVANARLLIEQSHGCNFDCLVVNARE